VYWVLKGEGEVRRGWGGLNITFCKMLEVLYYLFLIILTA
jgi:hypothetical protein